MVEQSILLRLLTIVLIALGDISVSAARPDENVEYLREFGNRARVRVVREVIVDDVPALLERQWEEVHAKKDRSATQQAFRGELTARYRVMFSPGPRQPERELLVEHDMVALGRPFTYRTWAAELSDDGVLILVYCSSEQDHIYAVDTVPPPEPGFEPRPRLPQEALRIPWAGRPTFLAAAVTGALLPNDLTVTVLRRPEDHGRARSATSQPAPDIRRYRLHREDGTCRWIVEAGDS